MTPKSMERSGLSEIEIGEFAKLAASKLSGLQLPGQFGAALVGSTAEGFGNALSDIDIYLMDDSERAYPKLLQPGVHGEQRIEFFFWNRPSLDSLQQRVRSLLSDDTTLNDLDDAREDLDQYQRICNLVPLGGHTVLAEITADFSEDVIRAVMSKYFMLGMGAALDRAAILERIGCGEAAIAYYRDALLRSAEHWACSRGETYSRRKFLMQKLARAEASEDLVELVRDASQADLAPPDWQAECARYRQALLQHVDPGPSDVRIVARDDQYSIREIWGRPFLCGRDRTWGIPAADVAELTKRDFFRSSVPLDGLSDAALAMVGRMFRYGLVKIEHGSDCDVFASYLGCVSSRDGFILAWNGVMPVPDLDHDEWVPYSRSITELAGAGLSLVTWGLNISNKREDFLGALRARRWDEVDFAFRDMVKGVCTLALAAHGVHPIPPREWLLATLKTFPTCQAIADAAVEALAHRIRLIDDVPGAYRALEAVIELVPKDVTGPSLLHVADRGDALFALIEMIGRWGGLGERIDVAPVLRDQVSDLVRVTQGEQDLLIVDPTSVASVLSWHREENVAGEIELARAP